MASSKAAGNASRGKQRQHQPVDPAFAVEAAAPAAVRTACAIAGVYSSGGLTDAAAALDRACGGIITEALDHRDLRGDVGEILSLRTPAGAHSKRLLLVGLGPRARVDRRVLRKALRAAFAALARTRSTDAVCMLTAEKIPQTDAYRRARIAIEAWHEATYRFTAMKSDTADVPAPALRRVGLLAAAKDRIAARRGAEHGVAVGRAVALAKELGNLPPNICTPAYLEQRARGIGRQYSKVKVSALGEPEIRKARMGAFLAVTQGSEQPPRFIILEYRGGKAQEKPVVLVGKGITFDTGGICIKPAPQMDEMKYDMCGAATVLGVMQAVAELGLKRNVIGLVPTCENMPSGRASRPGDIVRTMSGQTVEILNTDAEGRLILCDALTWAQRYQPAAMIDIATLTGACVIALGRVRSGLLANSDKLANALLNAGTAADDRAWRMPLDDEYGEQLKSNFADVANVGGREAGTITAASFLARFVGKTDWAHLDIAGTAWTQGAAKGGTGRPIPLLVEFLLGRT